MRGGMVAGCSEEAATLLVNGFTGQCKSSPMGWNDVLCAQRARHLNRFLWGRMVSLFKLWRLVSADWHEGEFVTAQAAPDLVDEGSFGSVTGEIDLSSSATDRPAAPERFIQICNPPPRRMHSRDRCKLDSSD